MEKSLLLRRSAFALIGLFLLFPVLHIFLYVPLVKATWDSTLLPVLSGAFVQATLSTGLTLFLALLTSFGLIGLQSSYSPALFKTLLVALALPGFVPPLIVVVLGANSASYLATGLWGVVIFHSLMNVGFISFLLLVIMNEKTSSWLKTALVSGVSVRRFVFRLLLPGMKEEFKVLSFYLFVLFFFSFSVPLLVGGSRYGGVEVFIYEKIVLFGQWGEAVQYSAGLFFLLLLIAFLLPEKKRSLQKFALSGDQFCSRVGFKPLVLVGLLPALVLLFSGLKASLRFFSFSSFSDIWPSIQGTVLSGLLTGVLVFIFLSLISYAFLIKKTAKFLLAMVNPGWSLVSFSFLLLGFDFPGSGFIKLSLALSLLYIPFLFRMSLHQKLIDIKEQVQVAQTLPADWNRIFFQIIWPQVIGTIAFLSGVAGVWACGDFAVSGIILDSSTFNTLALDIKSLMTSYRLEQSLKLLFPLLVSCLVVFSIFQGIAYVSRRNLSS